MVTGYQIYDVSGLDDAATGNDDDMVSYVLDLVNEMAGDKDSLAVGREGSQKPPDPADAFGIQAVGRLIQNNNAWIAEEGRGDPQPLTHPQRVRSHALPGGVRKSDELQDSTDPRMRNAIGLSQPGEMGPGCATLVGS